MIPSGRNSFQVAILVALALYGAGGLLFFDKVATTTIRSFPAPWGHLFLAVLTAASAVTLLGVLRHNLWGVLIEQGGLCAVSGLSVAYALWALATSGSRATAFALMFLAVAAASVGRITEIWHYRRRLRREAGEGG